MIFPVAIKHAAGLGDSIVFLLTKIFLTFLISSDFGRGGI